MGVFQSEKMFNCNPAMINAISVYIINEYQRDGYECGVILGKSGGRQISIRKGGIFKTVLGLKTSLNVNISPNGPNTINVKANVGLFETQALPTMIMWFAFWPVIVTQIWSLVQQSHLDEQVMDIVEKAIKSARFEPRIDPDQGVPL